ncbi:MAG: alpha-L-glutamate ligase-like protein, partial [Proteobacteria bacterium]|nr:alpha-L-glutamate ligase-like protein [Pseudomonadota bacterium]
MVFGLARRLKSAGVLGINKRNADYTLRYNQRRFYPLVDDKFQTKALAIKAGAAVPELYGAIEIQRDVRLLAGIIEGHDDFVIKPSGGSQGLGIIVVTGRSGPLYQLPDGKVIDHAA